jgi:hypothetical protein
MSKQAPTTDRPDPIIEYYKQFVDREALRENLKLTPEQRLQKLEERAEAAAQSKVRRPVFDPPPRWEAISDTGPDRTTDPVIELYKRDVDRTLLRANLQRTVEHRLQQLDAMGEFAEKLQAAVRRSQNRT